MISYNPAGGPLAGASQVYLHYGFNNWSPVVAPDAAMSWNATDSVWNLSVPVNPQANQLDLVFNNGAGVWDNNTGQDWHFNVTATEEVAPTEHDRNLDAQSGDVRDLLGDVADHIGVDADLAAAEDLT
jgi:hypothetical protein